MFSDEKPVSSREKPINVFDRLYRDNATVSYVIGAEEKGGAVIFSQFKEDITLNDTRYRPLAEITPSTDVLATPQKKKDAPYLTAKTPGGTEMESHRKMTITQANGEEQELFFLSPSKGANRKKITEAPQSHTARSLHDALKKMPAGVQKKGGYLMAVSLINRERSTLKKERAVMDGLNAQDYLLSAIKEKGGNLDPAIRELMQHIAENEYAEFLHAYAIFLSPKSFNTQTKENLGVGASWVNTAMLVLEKVAKILAKIPDIKSEVMVEFLMMPDTEVIQAIEQQVITEKRDAKTGSITEKIMMSRHLEPLMPLDWERNILPSNTDINQAARVAQQFLDHKPLQQIK